MSGQSEARSSKKVPVSSLVLGEEGTSLETFKGGRRLRSGVPAGSDNLT